MPSSKKSRAEQDAGKNLSDDSRLTKFHEKKAQKVGQSNEEQKEGQQRGQDGVGHDRWMA